MSLVQTLPTWTTTPLTTLFTPAPICTLPYLTYLDAGNVHIWGTDFGITTIQRLVQDCYPPSYFLSENDQKVIYSPGACPTGYTMAGVQFVDSGRSRATRASCCPSEASFNTDPQYLFNHCRFPVTSPGTMVVHGASTIAGSWIVVQKAVIVEWQSKDLDSFDPVSAPLSQLFEGSSSAPITTAPSSTTHSSSAPRLKATPPRSAAPTGAVTMDTASATATKSSSPTPKTGSSFSTGAKVGTGVGAAVGGIIILLLAVLLWVLRKKHSAKASRSSTFSQPSFERSGYQHHSGNTYPMYKSSWHEMSSDGRQPELYGDKNVYRTELEGDIGIRR